MDTLAQLVRAKYPGSYDSLSDEELEAKIDAKYPGAYDQVPRSKKAEAQPAAAPPAPATTPGRMSMFSDPRLDPAASGELTDEEVNQAGSAAAKGLATYGAVAGGVGAAAGGLPSAGQVGMTMFRALANPYVMGGVSGARTLVRTGDPIEAAKDAIKTGAETAIVGHFGGKIPLLARIAKSAMTGAEAAPAAAEVAAPVAEAVAPTVERAYRGIPSLMKIVGPTAEDAAAAANAARAAEGAGAAAGIAKTVPVAAEAAPVVERAAAPVVEDAAKPLLSKMGVTAAKKATDKSLMQFAKQIAKGNPKVGEKIWMELDAAGNPVKVLTPDQAAAAARAGRQTTWVKNLWN